METATAPDLTQLDAKIRRADWLIRLAVLVLIVSVGVMIIDQQIKRHIVNEGQHALDLLRKAQKIAREADSSGAAAAGEATASPGDSVNSDHGVDDAAGASAEPGGNARPGLDSQAGRVARPFGGPGGDG